MTPQVTISQLSTFLESILEEHATEKEWEWIHQQDGKLQQNFRLPIFYLTFSAAARFIRKSNLQLSEEQKMEAGKLRKGFQPEHWHLLHCVRAYFLLRLPSGNEEAYENNLNKLFETADIEEQVLLYNALPILPFPKVWTRRAAEGIRTNITDVFDAIALDNPYPADFLDQAAWNQMLLKAVFMQRPLYRISGADERANPELAAMLIDFAHERWAANRKVVPELWRFVGPFMHRDHLPDIKKVIGEEGLERQAGLLACAASGLPEAKELLDYYPEMKSDIESGRLSWTSLGKQVQEPE